MTEAIGSTNVWMILGVLVTVLVLFATTNWGVVTWLVNRLTSAMSDRLDGLSRALSEERQRIEHVDRALLELKAELPEKYVRREDQIRYAAVIEAKQDSLVTEIKALSIRVERAMNLQEIERRGTQ